MRRIGNHLGIFTALYLFATGPGYAQDDLYTRAVDLVDANYLHHSAVTPEGLLGSAAVELTRQVPWLFADVSDGEVRLWHPERGEIGVVRVGGWGDLAEALYDLEQHVAGSAIPWGDANLRLATLQGFTYGLDRYSRVLAGAGLDTFDTRLRGTLVGIGVGIRVRNGQLMVASVSEAGPAERAGLRAGDVIERIDGVSTLRMTVGDAVLRMRGEAGSAVSLDIRRDGALKPFVLLREEIVVDNVEHSILDGGVGYVRISHVSQRTTPNLRKHLAALYDAGAADRGLILDLRGNSGGSMKESGRVADQFLRRGMLFQTVGRDGEPVPSLLHRMDALDAGDEPPVPLIVLVDERSASGSEIIVGALKAHDRVVLLGQRTFGKGEVQKLFELGDRVQMKLTVAEYVLAGDRRVRGAGFVPDVTFGRVRLDASGVRFFGWDPEREQRPWDDTIPVVEELKSWRGEGRQRDAVLELARRGVLGAEGPGRDAVLASVRAALPAIRAEEEAALIDALRSKQIDWSAAASPGPAPDARVRLTVVPDADSPGLHRVRAEVRHFDASPLHRTLVRLRSEDESRWDGLVLAIGKLNPGQVGVGEAEVRFPAGLIPRTDRVGVELRAHQRPVAVMDEALLSVATPALPRVAADVRLLGKGADREVEVVVHNLGDVALSDVEVHLARPEDDAVELLDRGERLAEVAVAGTGTAKLALQVDGEVADPLRVVPVVRAVGVGVLGRWTVDLPLDGAVVHARSPEVALATTSTTAGTGAFSLPISVSDDQRVDAVVAFHDGRKVYWSAPRAASAELSIPLTLHQGTNRVVLQVRDDQGLQSVLRWHLVADEGAEAVVEGDEAP